MRKQASIMLGDFSKINSSFINPLQVFISEMRSVLEKDFCSFYKMTQAQDFKF